MTRRDYVFIAQAIKDARTAALHHVPLGEGTESVFIHGINSAAYQLARNLSEDNPKFDRQRFLDACGVPS